MGMTMKKYAVHIPITGSMIVTVEAVNEDNAKHIAWGKASFKIIPDNPDDCEAGVFELHEKIAYGNICEAECNEVIIEEV